MPGWNRAVWAVLAFAISIPSQPLRDSIGARMAALASGDSLRIQGDTLLPGNGDLETFYRKRAFRPSWLFDNVPLPNAHALREALKKSREDGLNPMDYHFRAIDSLLKNIPRRNIHHARFQTPLAADLELLLSDAFFKLARHLLYGRFQNHSGEDPWHQEPENEDLPRLLEENAAIPDGIRLTLIHLAPRHPEYRRLKIELSRQRKRLVTTVDSQADRDLKQRIERIKIGLEGWRWLPRDLGPKHIRVNIADYRLSTHANGREEFTLRVVVGSQTDHTPVFRDRISSLYLNPDWNVPEPIAREEILMSLRKNPAYLERNNMEIWENWFPNAKILRTDSMDWFQVPTDPFPYRIRQRPGPNNALGRIKFIFSNPFNIYLHDTPTPEIFEREKRTFSHGCIRVEKALDLAIWLLSPDSAWNRGRLQSVMEGEKSVFIPIPGGGVPVYILYWTTFADATGDVQFRPDVYGWNEPLQKKFQEKESGF